jgi:PAS domain S-box-containing protein
MKKLTDYVSKGKFYQAVVEDGSDIIFIVDFKGEILYHNDSVEEILGHKPGSLVGKSFFDFIHPDTLPSFRKSFVESTRKPYIEGVEFQFQCKPGKYKYLEFNSINLKQKEGLEGLILDCRDITERKRDAEELLRAQKAKEQFLANISHEIRTPINGIAGMAELLSQSPTPEEQTTYLNAIRSAADNLKVIINDILDLASIESGKLKFEHIGFSVKDLLASLINSFSVQAREKRIELKLDIEGQADTILIGDPVRLNQIMINLLSNAIKFTHSGTIQVNCGVHRKHGRNYDIRFEVSDTGIGIPQDKLNTIFESFSQADESVTRKYGGTGLGLTIVRQLVELQKGKITVDSKEGKGSSFTVHIPYLVGNTKDIVDTSRQWNIHRSLRGLNVLLVEDNDINRLYATSILKTWECNIDVAENGYVAVEKVKNRSFDIVLMDVQMPVMDGFEATKTIRMSEGAGGKVPIIALTANATRKDIEKCLALGMNDCIPKPFTPEDLFRALVKHAPAPVPETSVGQPLVDLSYLQRVSGNNAEFMKEMISTFLETMPKSISEIHDCLKNDDWAALGSSIHKIKPSLSLMGLAAAREAAAKIEHNAREVIETANLPTDTLALISQLEQALKELRAR